MPQDTSQPTSNPPGGGSWTWDSVNGAWLEKTPAAESTPLQPQAAPTADPE